MRHRSDDQLSSAWLKGDQTAVAAAWQAAHAAARRFAVILFGGAHKCICGESADDVAAVAVAKFAAAIACGHVGDVNLTGYLMTIVYHQFVDLTRRAKRETSLTGCTTDNGKGPLDVADLTPSPLRRLIARDDDAECRTREAARLREPLLAWCAWPATMWPLCVGRPKLREVLTQMDAYLRTKLMRAGATASAPGDVALVRLAVTADPAEVQYSRKGLDAFLEDQLRITPNNLYGRWRYLKQIGGAQIPQIPGPPGLMRDHVRAIAA